MCWWKNFLDFLLLIKMIHEGLWERKDTILDSVKHLTGELSSPL